MNEIKNGVGHLIIEGFYEDDEGFHYYHVKKTSENLVIKRDDEENYSSLHESFARKLIPLRHSEKLIRLINSVETGMNYSEREELVAEVSGGVLGKGLLEGQAAQTMPKCTHSLDAMKRDSALE